MKATFFKTLLKLLDRFEVRHERKNGHVDFKPCLIIVTCIERPEEFLKKVFLRSNTYDLATNSDLKQLLRRITVIQHSGEYYCPNILHFKMHDHLVSDRNPMPGEQYELPNKAMSDYINYYKSVDSKISGSTFRVMDELAYISTK
jgi:hypothetical protein